MTLPPPPLSAEDAPTFTDAEEELDWMLDCIAIETRIRTAFHVFGDADGSEEADSTVDLTRPWGRNFPPSSC